MCSFQSDIKQVVEALLFAAPEPLSLSRLEALTGDAAGKSGQSLSRVIEELRRDYEEGGRSFTIVKVAQGYQFKTRPEFAPWVRKLFQPRRFLRLSGPALETLAIIAFKQPLTRMEIELIRGVNVEGVIRSLLDRELIKIAGQKEVAGRPYLYRTSRRFLEHFGLNSLKDLAKFDRAEEVQEVVKTVIKESSDLAAVGREEDNHEDEDRRDPPPDKPAG
jgi:segregation and condensation protein B